MISADAITSRTFTTVRFKEGYSAREVDDFLDEIVDRMATDDHSLARRIKEHRARLGMSQADLARALFVTRQTISNWGTEGV